jgi:hypothetical protein
MYEEDHAPRSRSVRSIIKSSSFRLGKSGRTSARWLLKSLRAARARWTVVSLLAARDLNPTRHLARTVLLNV